VVHQNQFQKQTDVTETDDVHRKLTTVLQKSWDALCNYMEIDFLSISIHSKLGGMHVCHHELCVQTVFLKAMFTTTIQLQFYRTKRPFHDMLLCYDLTCCGLLYCSL